ncbi:AraC family transcriptional regulator [Paucibacter sp. M5-1]|uniref:AraC family transcriptional regulator n=1 Tax=Paucibacter sp. M5-1 TaxID=3015998 RepID=UPI0022B85894|nr:AraC family transcriptional regulator [Paucibacter sp. M5-1]MCZ7883021.1 AraC family transcriptional regulator [Paucibacter sp. M5-1]
MRSSPPKRLLNKEFFTEGLQLQLDRQSLDRPYGLHWHEFYELTLVLSGRGSNTVNGQTRELQAGDAFLLTPADFHAIAPAKGQTLELYNLIFSQALLNDELVGLLFAEDSGPYARFADAAAQANMIFRCQNLAAEIEGKAPGHALAAQGELNDILIAWHRQRRPELRVARSRGPRLAHHEHPGIQKALIHIQHHFRQPLSLQDAARQAHLSPNYFSELFHKATGSSFQHYLQQQRLRFAQALLQSSNLPVTELSYVAGFNTLTHFERVFRREFGMTPSQARQHER